MKKLLIFLLALLLISIPVQAGKRYQYEDPSLNSEFENVYLEFGRWNKKFWDIRNAKKFKTIQDALDDLPSTGGVVYVPAGTYTISSTIEMKDNQALIGTGPASIITTDVENLNLILCKDISASPYETAMAQISNLKLLGIDSGTGVGIKAENTHCLMMKNLWITKVYMGIEFVATADPSQHTDNNWILNSYFYDTIQHGIYFHPATDGRAENNIIKGNSFIKTGNDAIRLYPGRNNLIVGNQIERAGEHGILLWGGKNNIISGNVVFACTNHGIYLYDEEYDAVTGNSCYANDYEDTASFDGIYIKGDSNRNTITGNVCYANDRYGIHIDDATCDKNILLGNIVYGNTTGQIQDGGTGTVSEHNIVD